MSKLNNIQILRAIAALGVVLYHSGIESTTVCTTLARDCVYNFVYGGEGVPLFFMISGFIMVVTSWDSFATAGAPGDFMRRRLQRIVPLYWLITTIAVVGVWFAPAMLNVAVMDPAYVASSYLFWPVARLNGLVRPIANLGWTLNLEMMFYVVFTLSLFFSRARGMLYAIGFLLLLSLAQMAGTFAEGGRFASTPLNFWGDPIIINFILGMGIGALYRRGLRLGRNEVTVLLFVAVIFAVSAINIGGWLDSFPENHVISRMAMVPALLAFFTAAALGPQFEGKARLAKIGLLIGDASYSLYLIHPFVLRVFTKLWVKTVGPHLPVWCFTLLCIVGALTAGLILYRIFERPMNQLFARMHKRQLAKPVQVAHA